MTIAKLSTGIPGLDVLTNGGIPLGRATLIGGKSGAGKTVLVLELATHLALAGLPVLYVTAEERPSDIAVTGDSLGFETSRLVDESLIHVLDLRRPTEGPTVLSGDYDASGFLSRVKASVRDIEAKVVVIDSITALFQPRPPEEMLRAHFAYVIGALEALSLTVLVTAAAPSDYSRPTLLGVEDFVCDLVLALRNAVEGKLRRRSLEVHKYRRSNHRKGEYPFTITDGGIEVFPLDGTHDKLRAEGSDRAPSGIEWLDALSGGGWLRGTIVLARGPSGSGKTILAGMHARAAAGRGERVLYYSFGEPKALLLRSFASLDLPLEELERAGRLRLNRQHAEATSTEDLLIRLHAELEEFTPSLVIIDSLSEIENATSVEGYRVFLSGLVSLVRRHECSALLLEMVRARAELHQGPAFLMGAADAIMVLDYAAEGRELARTVRLLKMRGSEHDARQQPMQIVRGGLVLDDPRQLAESSS